MTTPLTYLFRRKNGNVVFIDESGFLFNNFRNSFFFEFFTSEPKENVFFRILTLEKVSKHFSTSIASHQFIKAFSPTTNLFQCWPVMNKRKKSSTDIRQDQNLSIFYACMKHCVVQLVEHCSIICFIVKLQEASTVVTCFLSHFVFMFDLAKAQRHTIITIEP